MQVNSVVDASQSGKGTELILHYGAQGRCQGRDEDFDAPALMLVVIPLLYDVACRLRRGA
jgi:hypothetical protein